MNKMSKTRAFSNLLLLSVMLSTNVAMADDVSSGAIVEAINNMNTNVGGKVDTVKQSVDSVGSQVNSGNGILQKILDKNDISNKEMVNALINYDAKSAVNRYAMEKELLFQVAPGSLWAATAGSQAGELDRIVTFKALDVASRSLVNSLAMLMPEQTSITIFGIPINVKDNPPVGYMSIYGALEDFFKTGNPDGLANINVGGLLQMTVIDEKVDPKTKQLPSQTIVNLLTNPFPVQDPALVQKLKQGALTPDDKENLGRVIGQYALMGVSANAWGDIVARRIQPSPGEKSVMQIMQQTSKDRFTSKDWYAAIGAASETALLREMAHMMAYNQWVQYQQFRMQEQQVSLLASINGVMAKLNVAIDEMTKEMAKARDEAREQAAKAEAKAEEAKKEAEAEAAKAKEEADKASSSSSSSTTSN